ncbi:MAG: hypothetical protein V4623_01810 [Pseudomonadota bacterium]
MNSASLKQVGTVQDTKTLIEQKAKTQASTANTGTKIALGMTVDHYAVGEKLDDSKLKRPLIANFAGLPTLDLLLSIDVGNNRPKFEDRVGDFRINEVRFPKDNRLEDFLQKNGLLDTLYAYGYQPADQGSVERWVRDPNWRVEVSAPETHFYGVLQDKTEIKHNPAHASGHKPFISFDTDPESPREFAIDFYDRPLAEIPIDELDTILRQNPAALRLKFPLNHAPSLAQQALFEKHGFSVPERHISDPRVFQCFRKRITCNQYWGALHRPMAYEVLSQASANSLNYSADVRKTAFDPENRVISLVNDNLEDITEAELRQLVGRGATRLCISTTQTVNYRANLENVMLEAGYRFMDQSHYDIWYSTMPLQKERDFISSHDLNARYPGFRQHDLSHQGMAVRSPVVVNAQPATPPAVVIATPATAIPVTSPAPAMPQASGARKPNRQGSVVATQTSSATSSSLVLGGAPQGRRLGFFSRLRNLFG